MHHRWTTADFDSLSWHDCHVHGFRLLNPNDQLGTIDLEFDIDFILEWRCEPDGSFRFLLAPATLTFHEVFALRLALDYAGAGMTPFSLAGIEREPLQYASTSTCFRWRLPINWPAGEISFQSPGFTQVLRQDPILHGNQSLSSSERSA